MSALFPKDSYAGSTFSCVAMIFVTFCVFCGYKNYAITQFKNLRYIRS